MADRLTQDAGMMLFGQQRQADELPTSIHSAMSTRERLLFTQLRAELAEALARIAVLEKLVPLVLPDA